MMTRDMRSMQLEAERVEIIRYLRVKVDVQDWHGVCDAANDLREIDAELRGLGQMVA